MSRATWWKRRLVDYYVQAEPDAHVLSENLRIADAVGVERRYLPTLPKSPQSSFPESLNLPFAPASRSFAVIHMRPGALVKQWPEDYWLALIESLRIRSLAVVATGSGSPAERHYVEGIVGRSSGATGLAPVCSLAGTLSFDGVVELVRHAALFVGTDTSTTHIAAATGVPTIALYGPTDPVRWGPWPIGLEQDGSPWNRQEAIQRAGNVTLLRASCGCASRGRDCRLAPGMPGACMRSLVPETVVETIDRILEGVHAVVRLG